MKRGSNLQSDYSKTGRYTTTWLVHVAAKNGRSFIGEENQPEWLISNASNAGSNFGCYVKGWDRNKTMNTKTKIYRRCADLFRVQCQDDWRRVSAADLLSVQGCGETFVLKLRLWLAHSGLNLRGDNPAVYWLAVERNANMQEIWEVICPFTIVVDTNEQYPFAFTSIKNKAEQQVHIPTITRPLYTVGGGDYTIDGMEDLVQLERKGDDLPSSLAQRRDAFEGEIRRLSESCEFAAVIVEHPWSFFLRDEHGYGMSGKAIHRTVTSWQVTYPGVHWWFCESRVHAENVAFRLLDCFWRSKQRELSELVRSAADADPFEAVDFD